jgi:hypothetical protein
MGIATNDSALPAELPPLPGRLRPFVRLALVGALVLALDGLTAQLSDRGVVLPASIVTVVRILAAGVIFRYPLAGVDQAWYQEWDKVLDLVTLGAAAATTLSWRDHLARNLALGAFAFRLVGVAAFTMTHERWILIAFPNLFESIYLLYMIFRVLTGQHQLLQSRTAAAVVVAALLIPKLAQEYFLHHLEQRPWHIYHVLPWPTINAWFWGGLLYALPLAALVVLVVRSHGRATSRDPEVQPEAPALPGEQPGRS